MRNHINKLLCEFTISVCPKLGRYYAAMMAVCILSMLCAVPVFAVSDIFDVAKTIIVDVYNGIAGISTVLAGLMSAVAVIGAKMSSNQHKVDSAWDWLSRGRLRDIPLLTQFHTKCFRPLRTARLPNRNRR